MATALSLDEIRRRRTKSERTLGGGLVSITRLGSAFSEPFEPYLFDELRAAFETFSTFTGKTKLTEKRD